MSDRIRIRRDTSNVQFGQTVLSIRLGMGLPEVDDLKDELIAMSDVLLGRADCPIESPYLALQEVATAYHARAREIEMLIYNSEQELITRRSDPLYKFRTGALSSFIDMTKRLADLGSRRLSQEQLLYQQRLDGSP